MFSDVTGFLKYAADFMDFFEEGFVGRTEYGAEAFYADAAWALEYLVSTGVPYFTGRNAASWTEVAKNFRERSDHYAGRDDALTMPIPLGEEGATPAQRFEAVVELVEEALRYLRAARYHLSAEQFDSDLVNDQRGITQAEAVKVISKVLRNIANRHWRDGFRYEGWVDEVLNDLTEVYRGMGEPVRPGSEPTGGDLDQEFPWSWPGQS